MKKIALIGTYCDTEEKMEILKKNCKILKSLGVDTFVYSPIKIDIESDFIFFTKENPITEWPEKSISAWKKFPYDGKTLKLQSMLKDTGWASIYQFKKGMEIISTFDYDIYYILIYDLKIDDQIISDIQNNVYNLSYPRRDYINHNQIYPATFHFTIFNKEKLIEVSNYIQLNEYKNENGFAEDFMHRWIKKADLGISTHVVTDLIHNPIQNVYNLSKNESYTFFMNRDIGKNFKIFFSDFSGKIDLKVNFFNVHIEESPKLVELPVKCEEVNSLLITYNENEINYTEEYNKISRNIIEFV